MTPAKKIDEGPLALAYYHVLN